MIAGRAVFDAPDLRALDLTLLLVFVYSAAQMLPLPADIIAVLSPNRAPLAERLLLAAPGGPRPLSIRPDASFHALLVLGSAIAVFRAARGVFHFGGIRTVTRSVAFCGLVAALIGVLQDAARTRLVYWWWAPISDGPPGFGPFINRNHFAAWAVMALPLAAGYLAARSHAPDDMDRFRSFAARLHRRLDFRMVWLLLAVGAMTAGVFLSLSRAGLAACLSAALAAHLMTNGRRRPLGRWPLAISGAILVVAILWTGPAALVGRWQQVEVGQEGRAVIWRDTIPVIGDFWLTGTGVGTYGDAMTVYQVSGRDTVHFNQAHNHFLQVLAEGGVLLFGLCAVAAWLAVRGARRRMRADHTGIMWLRVGAAAGLVGLAVNSLWETAARMPANALLAAVLAAVLLHRVPHAHSAARRH